MPDVPIIVAKGAGHMIIGVPREIKDSEYRVGLVPAGVHGFVAAGHKVLVEAGAGLGSGISDEDYERAGATLARGGADVYANADMIIKVKEPLPSEYKLVRKGQILYTYFHFAAAETLTRAMLESGAICIAYETMTPDGRSLPCLTPMSEVAGRMSVQEGAKYLERPMEGRGILLGGVPGVHPGEVVVLGGGIVGTAAAKIASGMGANVTVLDVNLERLRYLDDVMPPNVTTIYSNAYNIREAIKDADLLVGAILLPGAIAPKLVRREDLAVMQQGSVIIDVAVDQGGCVETTKPTTHSDPTYIVDGVVHYGVANMPGAVGRTSTFALTNVTTPYGIEIAKRGWKEAARAIPAIRTGLNMVNGKCVYRAVADAFKGMSCTPVEDVLGG